MVSNIHVFSQCVAHGWIYQSYRITHETQDGEKEKIATGIQQQKWIQIFFFFGFVFLASERLLLLLVPSLWLFHRIVAPKFIVVDYKYMVRNNLHEERGEMGSGLHNHGPLKIVTKE
jgi:hypothetical protein